MVGTSRPLAGDPGRRLATCAGVATVLASHPNRHRFGKLPPVSDRTFRIEKGIAATMVKTVHLIYKECRGMSGIIGGEAFRSFLQRTIGAGRHSLEAEPDCVTPSSLNGASFRAQDENHRHHRPWVLAGGFRRHQHHPGPGHARVPGRRLIRCRREGRGIGPLATAFPAEYPRGHDRDSPNGLFRLRVYPVEKPRHRLYYRGLTGLEQAQKVEVGSDVGELGR